MRIISPRPDERFTIGSDTTPPVLNLQTDGTGPHVWDWTMTWRTHTRSGRETTTGNTLRLHTQIADIGGRLAIGVLAGGRSASVTVQVVGTNPTAEQLRTYVNAQPNSRGFLTIINHESRGRHFNDRGEPIRSFDGGYGMCQLTNPAPTFEQCWSWKQNVLGGLRLFAEKRIAAINYLRQRGRVYTDLQLERETVARWNGGAYHSWSGTEWVRNPDILCAPGTGNIGWDMTDPRNAGQTLEQLRTRDAASFRRPRAAGAPWRYTGVCYADALL